MQLSHALGIAERVEFLGDDVAIPDESSVESTITVTDAGEIEAMSVQVEVTHTFPYELTLRFGRVGGDEVVLLTEDTSSETGVDRTFEVPDFLGEDIGGDWKLTIVDRASGDVGTLVGWSIHATTR